MKASLARWKEVWQEDGALGILEKILFSFKKGFWTAYYCLRLGRLGHGSVVTGRLSFRGGKRISVGEQVVIEGGASLRATGGGRIEIGSQSFIETGARLISEGTLTLGEKVTVLKDAEIVSCGIVQLGHRVWIARGSSVGGKDVCLEDEVILGPGVFVMDGDHEIQAETGRITMHSGVRRPVLIKSNAWLGARSIVLKGVTVGEGAIIGAGSVVTKEVPPHTVAVGVPARVERTLEVYE